MKKMVSGKVSILVLTAAFAISAFFFGKSFNIVLGNDQFNVCHNTHSGSNPWVVQQVSANELQSHLDNGDFLYNGPLGDNGHPNHANNADSIWCQNNQPGHSPSPTATSSASPSASPTASPVATPTASPKASPTASPTVTPTATPTASPTASPSISPSPSANPSCLGDIPSNLLVNVTEGVTNDVDSGFHGYWAIDAYIRHIKVWRLQQEGNIYCADVRYDGTFDVQPGVLSPQNGNPLTGNEDGVMTGGRRAQINGHFSSEPVWNTTGDVGSYNYACLIDGTCTGRFSWVNKYFGSDYGYSDLNWGWTYRSCGHGQWINASTGSSGDIVVGPTEEVCQTSTPIPTPAPTTPNCGSDEHLDLSGTKCLRYELGGPPPPPPAGEVLGASTKKGQVLGASTMAKTGTFEGNLYLAIMSLGGTLTAFGFKSIKKTSKKA